MILKIVCIENIGKFRACKPAGDVELRPVSLVYAENGRGKTTLCDIQTMDWAGHEDANTTRGYVVAANNLAQEIAAKLHVPHFVGGRPASRLSWEDLT